MVRLHQVGVAGNQRSRISCLTSWMIPLISQHQRNNLVLMNEPASRSTGITATLGFNATPMLSTAAPPRTESTASHGWQKDAEDRPNHTLSPQSTLREDMRNAQGAQERPVHGTRVAVPPLALGKPLAPSKPEVALGGNNFSLGAKHGMEEIMFEDIPEESVQNRQDLPEESVQNRTFSWQSSPREEFSLQSSPRTDESSRYSSYRSSEQGTQVTVIRRSGGPGLTGRGGSSGRESFLEGHGESSRYSSYRSSEQGTQVTVIHRSGGSSVMGRGGSSGRESFLEGHGETKPHRRELVIKEVSEEDNRAAVSAGLRCEKIDAVRSQYNQIGAPTKEHPLVFEGRGVLKGQGGNMRLLTEQSRNQWDYAARDLAQKPLSLHDSHHGPKRHAVGEEVQKMAAAIEERRTETGVKKVEQVSFRVRPYRLGAESLIGRIERETAMLEEYEFQNPEKFADMDTWAGGVLC